MAEPDIENLEEVLRDYLDGKILKQTISRLTEPGQNFCSVIHKVDINVKNEDGEKVKNFVVKTTAPTNEHLMIMFGKELDFYGPVYQEIERFAKLQKCEEFLRIFPEYFGGRKSLKNPDQLGSGAILILENLAIQGYNTAERKIGFSIKQAKASLSALSVFHSLGIGMYLKERRIFDEKVLPNVQKLPSPPEGDVDDPINDFVRKSIRILKKSNKNFEAIQRLEKILESKSFWGSYDRREPWITFSHNDFWVNNIMLKEDGDDICAKILDFQAVSCNSPAKDLAFFMFTSLKDDIIRNNIDELVQYYHNSLINNLKKLKITNLEQYSYEGLLNEIRHELVEGEVGHILTFLLIVLQDKENAEDIVNNQSNVEKMFQKEFSLEHKSRLLVAFECLVEHEWI